MLYTYKKFQSAEGNCKKTWQLINELRGKSSKATKPYFIINGDIIVNRRKIADEFNKYFLSIATELNANSVVSELALAVRSLPQFTDYLFKPVCSSIYMDGCTDIEIQSIIAELSSAKASDIPVRVLKACKGVIAPVLSKFYNAFMEASNFPDILKVAQITPIFKKGDVQLLDNYRPILYPYFLY